MVAAEKKKWRARNGRRRRPAVWTPGDSLVIDWGALSGTEVHVFCAVLAWSRIRFVRYARDETAATTFAVLAECFETLGGVPAKVLADRMACLKAGTVAQVVMSGSPDALLRRGPLRTGRARFRASGLFQSVAIEHLVPSTK